MFGRSFRRTPEEPGPPLRNRNNRNNRRGRGGGGAHNQNEEGHRSYEASDNRATFFGAPQQDIPSLFDYRGAPVPQWTANDPVWGNTAEQPAQAPRNRPWRGRGSGARHYTNRTDPFIIDPFGNVYAHPLSTDSEWLNHPPPNIFQQGRAPESNRGRRGRGAHQPASRAVPPHFLIADTSDVESDNTSIFSLLFAPEPTPPRRSNRTRGGRGGARQQDNRAATAPTQNNWTASHRETWADHPFQRPDILFPNADDEWGTDGGWGGRRREEPAVAEPTRGRRNRNRGGRGRGGAHQQANRTVPSGNAAAERPQPTSARGEGGAASWEFGRGGFDDAENVVPDEPAPEPTSARRNRNRGRRGGRGRGARQQDITAPAPSRDNEVDPLQDAFGNLDFSRDDTDWGTDWGGGFANEERAAYDERATESRSSRRNRNRRRRQAAARQQASPAAAAGSNRLDPANAEITSNEWARIVNPFRQARNNNDWHPGLVPPFPPGLRLEEQAFDIGPPPGLGRPRGNSRLRDRLRRAEELRDADPYSYLDGMDHRGAVLAARFPRSPFDFAFDYVGEYLGVDDNFSDDLTVSSTPEPEEDPEKVERLKQARDVDLQDDTLAMRYSRACGVCQISPNPRVRFVLTGCGHIVCAPCSEQLDNVGRKARCPFCRVTGGLLRLFEELEEENTSCQTSA